MVIAFILPAAGTEPAGPALYECPSFTLAPDMVRKGERSAHVDRASGELVSDGTDGALGARKSWSPSHDLSGLPQFSSAHGLIDAVYRMALDDSLKCVNEAGAFGAGAAFGVWVRDSAYAALLSTAMVFPEATKRSLEATVIEGETVRPEQLYAIHQGVPYSMSDFVVWVPAAWEYAKVTGDVAFIERHYDEMTRTIDLARRLKFDPVDGLYTGGCSFFDGHNGYPEGTTGRNILKGTSTNVLHFAANVALARMGAMLGKPARDRFQFLRHAYQLKDSINDKLWLASKGFYAQLKVGLAPPVERSEGLGEALAILMGVTTPEQTRALLAGIPDSEWGMPSVWPVYGDRVLYHDQSVWPFVESFWSLANARRHDPGRLMKGIAVLTQMAALELTFKELTRLDDGDGIGSDNQLWSAAGYLGLVLHGLFGLEADSAGLVISPTVPEAFAGGISLVGLRWRDAVLDIEVTGSGTTVSEFTLDGERQVNFVPADIRGRHAVRVRMSDSSPFVEIRSPEHIGLGMRFSVVVQHKLSEDLKLALYVRTGAASGLVRLPATGGTGQRQSVTIDTSGDISSLPAGIRFVVALEDAEGVVRALSHWRYVELRPPIEARFDPGALVYDRPVAKGTAFNVYLALRSSIPELTDADIEWSVSDALELTITVETGQLPPFSTGKVFATLNTTRELGYGRHVVKATAYSRKAPPATAEIAVIVADKIDLRGTWLVKKADAEDVPCPEAADGWTSVNVPGKWEDIDGFEDYDGLVWYRRNVTVPAEWAGCDVLFRARDIDDDDTTYFNGAAVGATEGFRKERAYRISSEVVRFGGENAIAVLVRDIGGEGGLRGWPIELEVTPTLRGHEPSPPKAGDFVSP